MDIIVQHTVRDYDAWKPAFDEHEPTRAKFGCKGHTIYRDPDDPNEVTILTSWESREGAEQFITGPVPEGGHGEGRRHLRAAGHPARRGRDALVRGQPRGLTKHTCSAARTDLDGRRGSPAAGRAAPSRLT